MGVLGGIMQLSKSFLTLMVLFVFLAAGLLHAQEPLKDTDPVAKVGETIIPYKDLHLEFDVVKKRQAAQGRELTPEESKKLQGDILDWLIDKEVLRQECQRQKIEPSQEEIQKTLDNVISRSGGKENFEKKLKEDFLTPEEYRQRIEKGLAIKKLIEKETAAAIKISEEEKKDFYEKNKKEFEQPEAVQMSHILINVKPGASKEETEKARKKIEEILAKVKAGEDFAELARKNSECPTSSKGGDLGYVSKGKMVPEFEKAAFALKPGQVSDIVQTQFGFHIIKVGEKRPAQILSYEKVEKGIENALMNQKSKEWITSYLKKLRAQTEIKKFL
jgi:peptidyl-prolyl cis-trans isomerase C